MELKLYRTDAQPVWRNNMAFLFHLKIHGDPQRYFCLIRWAQGTVCSLVTVFRIERTTIGQSGRTDMNAVRSMEIRGIISTSSSDATSSSSGGVIEFLNATGSAMTFKSNG